MEYPTPSTFKDIFEDSDDFNDETNRWLEQISLQAEFGRLTLAFLLERLREGDLQILQKFPIPKIIRTEDGYEFMLSSSQKEFEAKGDLIIGLEEVLELMFLTSKKRAEEIFPYFSVNEWVVNESDGNTTFKKAVHEI